MAPADELLLVTTPEVSAVRDADRVIGLAEAAGKPTPRLLINRIKPKLVARGDMLDIDDVCDILQIAVLGVVPEDEDIVASTNRGEPIALRTDSPAAAAFANIAARLEDESVPLISLDGAEPGLLARLARRFRRGD
jgi:septum site-determining protein MinD